MNRVEYLTASQVISSGVAWDKNENTTECFFSMDKMLPGGSVSQTICCIRSGEGMWVWWIRLKHCIWMYVCMYYCLWCDTDSGLQNVSQTCFANIHCPQFYLLLYFRRYWTRIVRCRSVTNGGNPPGKLVWDGKSCVKEVQLKVKHDADNLISTSRAVIQLQYLFCLSSVCLCICMF